MHSSMIAGSSNFTLLCPGINSCVNSTVDARNSLFVDIDCDGPASCAGATTITGLSIRHPFLSLNHIRFRCMLKGGVCATLIHCHGEASCSGRSLDASRSVEVHILCEDVISCIGTVLLCGTGACSLHCAEGSSCQNIVVDTSSATSFTCTGSCESASIPDNFGDGATIPLPFICTGATTEVMLHFHLKSHSKFIHHFFVFYGMH